MLNSFIISSFLIWSNLVHPLTVLKYFISAALILFHSFHSVQTGVASLIYNTDCSVIYTCIHLLGAISSCDPVLCKWISLTLSVWFALPDSSLLMSFLTSRICVSCADVTGWWQIETGRLAQAVAHLILHGSNLCECFPCFFSQSVQDSIQKQNTAASVKRETGSGCRSIATEDSCEE
jgi:hypothetical protein